MENLAIDVVSSTQSLSPSALSNSGTTENFAAWFEAELAKTNTQIRQADEAVSDLVLGKTDNLHQVMISLEKAKLSFELMVQVRNKALEGYQEIMRMQI